MSSQIKCSQCKKEKSNDQFEINKRTGQLLKSCNRCREKNKEYQQQNKDILAKRKKEYRDKNKDKIAKKSKEYRENNKCIHNKRKHRCVLCSPCPHNKVKERCIECSPHNVIRRYQSKRIRDALKAKKTKKSIDYLGCGIDNFKEHIESTFQEGMTWDNYGDWHIDHITPIAYGNPTLEQVKERLHYTNTQALWAEDNIAKGNRYIG